MSPASRHGARTGRPHRLTWAPYLYNGWGNPPEPGPHDMVTVPLGGTGTIHHVVNGTGGPSDSGSNVADLVNHP